MSVPQVADGALIRLAAEQPAASLDDLVGAGGVLVLAPHPDDETLGCGAAIMSALASGRRVVVALLTGGGASHPASRTHPPPALVALRRREFAAALATLAAEPGKGALDSLFLGLSDAAVPHTTAALAPLAQKLAAITERRGLDAVWSTWRGDPHTDHQAAARLADLVVAHAATDGRPMVRRDYAVWGRFGAPVPAGRVLPFAPGEWRAAKSAAMAAYASQLTPLITDDTGGFLMPPALTAHFAEAPEIFVAEDEEGA